MQRLITIMIFLLALTVAAGCGESEEGSATAEDTSAGDVAEDTSVEDASVEDTSAEDTAEPDAAEDTSVEDTAAEDTSVEDTAAEDTAGSVCGPPDGPFGTSEGSKFLPFTLDNCDGEPFEFYSEEEGYCESMLTVVSIAAGWCGPCRIEAELMQAQLVDAYAEQGVRVVVAIVQDNNYGPPSAEFCHGWVSQYGLTNPVLLDPFQETNIYFPGGALPASLIVDSEGVIVHREYGVSDNLESIRARIDQLLAE